MRSRTERKGPSTRSCLPSLVALSSARETESERKRSRRGDPPEEPTLPPLGTVERDREGRIVYVDLQPRPSGGDGLDALRSRLLSVRPTRRVLDRLTPINRGRLLVEIEDAMALDLFRVWLLRAMGEVEALGLLLTPLGPRIRLLGAQFIVPKVTEYEPRVAAQSPHTDVDTKGEVISVAIHLHGDAMGTLIDATARVDSSGAVTNGSGFGRAMTSIFAYDTGAVHAGPSIAHVPPPYPQYLISRVFVLLCADTLDPRRIAQHRHDNGLRGAVDLTLVVPSQTDTNA